MLDPAELYDVEPEAAVPAGEQLVLITALDGFVDAGGAVRLLRDHLLAIGEPVPLATFDVDQLHDYRARRPAMEFATDHWVSADVPSLTLDRLTDGAGRPFLLLSGPEPDLQWERFVAATGQLIERFGVELTVGVNAIPMAVPHTRPVGVIAHSSRPELVSSYDTWVDEVTVPGSAGHLLEFRRAERGLASMGFAVHVPHYLVQGDYPAAAARLAEAIAETTGLVLPADALHVAAVAARAEVDTKVAESEQVSEVVRALEAQYDAFRAGRGQDLLARGGPLPTADELGAELERFLADRGRRPDTGEL